MQVRRLPVDPGPAAWDAILPARADYPVLDTKITADWLVIGAGFAGLSAARRLRQLHPSARIVVLEANRVATGPAGRNSGFMIDLPHDLASDDYGGDLAHDTALTLDNRAAIDFAASMAADYGLGAEAFVRSGKINGAATEKGMRHNAEYAQHLAHMGEPSEMLDAAQMRDMTGIDYYKGGLFTAGTAIIQPAAFVRGVARGLTQDGVQVFENSPVTQLDRHRRLARHDADRGR